MWRCECVCVCACYLQQSGSVQVESGTSIRRSRTGRLQHLQDSRLPCSCVWKLVGQYWHCVRRLLVVIESSHNTLHNKKLQRVLQLHLQLQKSIINAFIQSILRDEFTNIIEVIISYTSSRKFRRNTADFDSPAENRSSSLIKASRQFFSRTTID